MKRILLVVGAGALVLIAILVVRTGQIGVAPPASTQKPPLISVNAQQTAAHLAQAVQFRTISTQDPADFDPAPFIAFHHWLGETYPNFYARVQTEMVDSYSQMSVWPGSDASLAPIVFLAHQDVVPASEAADSGWQKPPFDGVIDNGFIWGRGTLDDKGSLIAIMEAADRLAASGFVPKRTLIFAFGHNEEVLGSGAKTIAQLLKKRGIKPYAVIDEGGAITTNMPDAAGPVARIGVAEKGYVTLKLTARADGGHSSTPPTRTAIGALSRAIVAIEAAPFAQKIDPVIAKMLHATAPEQSFFGRLAIANLWLFEPMVSGKMKNSKTGRAMLGTTIAPTIVHAGFKENALPREASVYVNFRLHARDTIEDVIAHVRGAVNDPDIEISFDEGQGTEPSPVSQIGTGPYAWLAGVVGDVFPGTIIAPNVVLGGTDSRYFSIVTDDIYRFAPFTFDAADFGRLHGLNERIAVDDFARGVQAYYLMLERAGKML